MTRLAITLSTIIILALTIIGLPVAAYSNHISHQNPATAIESLPPTQLILFYGSVFQHAAERHYRTTQDMLDEMAHADIPEVWRESINSYNRLTTALVGTLDRLERQLNEASVLFSLKRTDKAEQKLDAATETVYLAQLQLEDIETSTNILGENLGVFITAPDSEIRAAYDFQHQSLARVRQLIDRLNQLRESLRTNPLTAFEFSLQYPTLLEVSAPAVAHPGLPVEIRGHVISPEANPDRKVRIFLDNIQLTEETVNGQFVLATTIPPKVLPSNHTLTVLVAPDGLYSSASRSMAIDISRLPLRAQIDTPQLTIIPGYIKVRGTVLHDNAPLAEASVSVAFKDHTVKLKTSPDGSFTTAIQVPFDLSLIGPQSVNITVEPVEPWYAVILAERQVFTLNPAIVGLIIIASLSTVLLLVSRSRTVVHTLPVDKAIHNEVHREAIVPGTDKKSDRKPDDNKSKILTAYLAGLREVERAAGINIEPQTTLREFLYTAITRLPQIRKPFTGLTVLAETALYSAHVPDENKITLAKSLNGDIRKELKHEAS